jgi:putative ATP-dependent endonuclease of OLD family
MKIHSVSITNYRPFLKLNELKVGSLTTIVGKNDVGKSSILVALKTFFKNEKLKVTDFHDIDKDVEIEISFNSLPNKIEFDEGIETTLEEEMLVDSNCLLRVRKTYSIDTLKPQLTLIVKDFNDERFLGLVNLTEVKLNRLCSSLGIDVTTSSETITNKDKRDLIRAEAYEIKSTISDIEFTPRSTVWNEIENKLPGFDLFEVDTRLGIDERNFQSEFNYIVEKAAKNSDLDDAKKSFTDGIKIALQNEIEEIFKKFVQHTDEFIAFRVEPNFDWNKAVKFKVLGKDSHNMEISLDQRGAGVRRLMMVSFFQYVAEKGINDDDNFIFGIEEPENSLHPGLQRELFKSFSKIANEGYQIILTSHSPVFASSSPAEDLALIIREDGIASAEQFPHLNLIQVAKQLGIEPSDQITGYNACIFVEGPTDIKFWSAIAKKLKEEGYIEHDFSDKKIGFVMHGGDTLKHWIDLKAMNRLNRKFAVVIDSDKSSSDDVVDPKKLRWKEKIDEEGGLFYILRKREIENYLHPDALERITHTIKEYDDYSDMKKIFDKRIIRVIDHMSAGEILEMDIYNNYREEKHELVEILESFLKLV